jgi:F-type H+-transporting ATPase subunit a
MLIFAFQNFGEKMQAYTLKSAAYFCLILVVLLFSFSQPAFSESNESSQPHKKGFNAGEMIIEHIVDNHEWHIAEIGNKPVTIPLPVILYDDGKIVTFMSSRFHHGADTYKGYKLELEGKNKGKIVKVDETGLVDENAFLPLDFSITKNVLSLLISVFLLTWIFVSIASKYKKRSNSAPKGFQNMVEPLILFIRDDIAKSSIGEKRYERYMPFLLTVFFFIFFNNLLGLVPFFPGGANLTGNIAVTMVMALFTFVITTFSGNKHYWKEIYNAPGVPWWLKFPVPLMPLVEVIGVITKPFVLMVRLFANITAGHIIALGFISLIFIFGAINQWAGYGFSIISVFFYIFMGLLELLVAFIQAYVFTLLSALYFGMASAEHHETAH